MHLEVNTMNDNPELNLTSNLNSSAHEPQPTRNVIDKLINFSQKSKTQETFGAPKKETHS